MQRRESRRGAAVRWLNYTDVSSPKSGVKNSQRMKWSPAGSLRIAASRAKKNDCVYLTGMPLKWGACVHKCTGCCQKTSLDILYNCRCYKILNKEGLFFFLSLNHENCWFAKTRRRIVRCITPARGPSSGSTWEFSPPSGLCVLSFLCRLKFLYGAKCDFKDWGLGARGLLRTSSHAWGRKNTGPMCWAPTIWQRISFGPCPKKWKMSHFPLARNAGKGKEKNLRGFWSIPFHSTWSL